VNLESQVNGKTTSELLLMTHCGMVMDVVQTTAAAIRLGLPWFYRTLPQEVGDDIEVRLCATEGIDNEEVFVELVEIFV